MVSVDVSTMFYIWLLNKRKLFFCIQFLPFHGAEKLVRSLPTKKKRAGKGRFVTYLILLPHIPVLAVYMTSPTQSAGLKMAAHMAEFSRLSYIHLHIYIANTHVHVSSLRIPPTPPPPQHTHTRLTNDRVKNCRVFIY